MTKILIASLNYAPEETGIAPYSTRVAEHLAARGYAVTVVAGMPHYPGWRVAPGYAGRQSMVETRNGVEIRRHAHSVPGRQSAFRRALYEATSLSMTYEALRAARPDAILGIVPSLSGGIAARTAAMRFGVPYALVFQDLVGQAAGQSGIVGGGRISGIVRRAEAWAAKRAAAVGIISEGFRPYVEGLGVDPGRIRRIRNWTHVTEPTIERSAMRTWLGWPADKIVCIHAGNMGHKQGLENVVEAARLAQMTDAPLEFVLMGDGNQREVLTRLAGRYGLQNLRFMPLQPDDVFTSAIAAADILLVNQRGSVRDMSLPSKLTSYFAAGRPVVAAAAQFSETACEIRESSGGIVVAPDSPSALLDGVMRVASDPGLAQHLAISAGRWARERLSEDAALRSYEQLIAAVLAAGKHGRVHTAERLRTTPPQPSSNGHDRKAA